MTATQGEVVRVADCGAPSEADIQAVTTKVIGLHFPKLTGDSLCYGWFGKGKGAYVWCRKCLAWVGAVKVDPNTYGLLFAPFDGRCPHYDEGAKRQMLGKEWGPAAERREQPEEDIRSTTGKARRHNATHDSWRRSAGP